MSEHTITAAQQEEQQATIATATEPVQDDGAPEEATAQGEDTTDYAALVRRAGQALAKGDRGLLLSRLECGLWCHRYYAARLAAGIRDRNDTTKLLTGGLAPYAHSSREVRPAGFARYYGIASVLAPEILASTDHADKGIGSALAKLIPDGMSIAKLEALSPLVIRPDGTECYALFCSPDDKEKSAAARALWTVAGGVGKERVSADELSDRVLALRDPEAHAKKRAAAAQESKDGQAGATESKDEPRATTADDTEGDNPADQRGAVSGNLLKSAAEATPGNLAESLAEQTEAGSDPHDTFERYLSLIAGAAWSDAPMKRAAKAALLILKRADSPSPVDAASALAGATTANGAPVSAA
jgi:hypothetical protein